MTLPNLFRSLITRLRYRLKKIKCALPEPVRMEAKDLEKTFARLFATDDGKKVLGHLNGITFMRTAPPDAPDHMLRHLEGQRSLLTVIIRLIERGRAP